MHLADEVLDHFLRNFEIGNNAVAHRTDSLDIAGRTTQHHLGVVTDRANLFLSPSIDGGDDRRLVQHDAASFDIDQRICCSEINRHIARQCAEKTAEHVRYPFLSVPTPYSVNRRSGEPYPGSVSCRGNMFHRATVNASGASFSRFTNNLLSAFT